MMINSKDLATILSLLAEIDKPFETIATTFHRTFNKNDHFKVGCAIFTILKDGFIRIPTQRLVSFYILFSLYKPDSSILSSGSLSSSSILPSSTSTSTSTSSSPSTSTTDLNTSNSSNNNNNNNNNNKQDINSNKEQQFKDNNILFIENIADYPIAFNPFLPIFIDELEKQLDSSNSIEKHILPLFLTNLPKDFSKKTPKEIINNYISSINIANTNIGTTTAATATQITKLSLMEYKKFYLERLPNHCFPSFRSIGISQNIITKPFSPTTTTAAQPPSTSSLIKNHEINSEELSFFSFEPNFKRVDPPIFNPVTTTWINSSIHHGLLLSNPPLPTIASTNITSPTLSATNTSNINNTTITTDTTTPTTTTTPNTNTNTTTIPNFNSKKIVRDLMTKAIKGRLKRNQQQQIKNEMDADPKLALYCGLTAKNLPLLVENNTQLAIDTLLKLIDEPLLFNQLIKTLISMEMNLRSMEVVNVLFNSVQSLPSHFISMYITNCIHSCKNIKDVTTDQTIQHRLVRRVCVFIQALIRNNIINIKNLFTELQSFCFEFSKIREAISLFKTITENNNIDDENTTTNTTNITNTTTTTT